jgi:hypothetical protein
MLLPVLATVVCASPETFALIVGNNASSTQQLPALQFADDDAMKYALLLQGFLGEDHVQVLTRLDRDSARLFSGQSKGLVAPTRQAVESAFAELKGRLEAARSAGRPTAALFIFAGHGDVDEGRGFLELEDGRWTSEDMERELSALPADAVHVLLDSCNSFFVLNPRKPGGRRFATAKDAAESLARRLPKVGVFLSTSAENETYEWSELGSGIFSHVVRSGLMGGADLDGDGAITYQELQSFVAVATQDIKNPNLRPHVFARGPSGQNSGVLLAAPAKGAVVLKVKADQPTRVQLKDHDGVRWFDLFAEARAPFSIRVPESLAALFEVRVEREAQHWDATLESASGEVELEALGRIASRGAQERGVNDSLRALFQTPYGPSAVKALAESEAGRPEPVYGVSREDLGRLGAVVRHVAEQGRTKRLIGGVGVMSVGAAMGAVALYVGGTGRIFSFGTLQPSSNVNISSIQAVVFGGGALVLLGMGLFELLWHSDAEKLYEKHREALSGSGGPEVVAAIEADLQKQLEDEGRRRGVAKVAGWAMLALGALDLGLGVYWGSHAASVPAFGTVADLAFFSGVMFMSIAVSGLLQGYLFETPTETILRGWQEDPSRSRLKVEPSAFIVPGGGGLSLSARF